MLDKNTTLLLFLRYAGYLKTGGDTSIFNDVVTKQYESLPYPSFNITYLTRDKEHYRNDDSLSTIAPSATLENYNHYLLCYPDVPWKEDPLRENPHDRKRIFDLYLTELKDKPLTIISGNKTERIKQPTNRFCHLNHFLAFGISFVC